MDEVRSPLSGMTIDMHIGGLVGLLAPTFSQPRGAKPHIVRDGELLPLCALRTHRPAAWRTVAGGSRPQPALAAPAIVLPLATSRSLLPTRFIACHSPVHRSSVAHTGGGSPSAPRAMPSARCAHLACGYDPAIHRPAPDRPTPRCEAAALPEPASSSRALMSRCCSGMVLAGEDARR